LNDDDVAGEAHSIASFSALEDIGAQVDELIGEGRMAPKTRF